MCFGLWSSIENLDFFKKILVYLYEITQANTKNLISILQNSYKSSTLEEESNITDKETRTSINNNSNSKTNNKFSFSNLDDSKSLQKAFHYFKKCEVLNFLIFLTKIIKPSPFTKLNINFHFNSSELYMHSLTDLPNKDSSVQILLDCLELSTIIKLWCSLLCEKHVILIGLRSVLYPACSALLALLFPLKWMHTYIPILPDDFDLEFLESPPPYLIGLPNKRVDFRELCEEYPYHVICDLSTSQISKAAITPLPEQDEIKIRTKVRLLRYPKLDVIEDLFEEPEIQLISDVNPNDSFPKNIQRIFFRIFKNDLCNVEEYLNKKYKFNQKDFLDNFDGNERKSFWEEVSNTQAFETFILGYKYLDDENTIRFRNMKHLVDISCGGYTKDSCYEFSFNMPDCIGYIIDEVIFKLEDKDGYESGNNNDLLANYNNDDYELGNGGSYDVRNSIINIDKENSNKEFKEFLIYVRNNYSSVIEELINLKNNKDIEGDLFNSIFELNSSKSNSYNNNGSSATNLNIFNEKSNSSNNMNTQYSNNPFRIITDNKNTNFIDIRSSQVKDLPNQNNNNNSSLDFPIEKSIILRNTLNSFSIRIKEGNNLINRSNSYINNNTLIPNTNISPHSSNININQNNSNISANNIDDNSMCNGFNIYGQNGFLSFVNCIFRNLTEEELNNINLKSFIEEDLKSYEKDNDSIKKFKFNNCTINSALNCNKKDKNQNRHILQRPTISKNNTPIISNTNMNSTDSAEISKLNDNAVNSNVNNEAVISVKKSKKETLLLLFYLI